jgi:hypothetical protein
MPRVDPVGVKTANVRSLVALRRGDGLGCGVVSEEHRVRPKWNCQMDSERVRCSLTLFPITTAVTHMLNALIARPTVDPF